MKRLFLFMLPPLLALCACSHKAEPVKILRFEQFLWANPDDHSHGTAADFQTPLLNYHPDDPSFMMVLADFKRDELVNRIYNITDSLYHDLSWLEQELGDAMSKAREICPEVDYRHVYTLITADIGNYADRVFCDHTDMAISIDCYTLGHVPEMQQFGTPNYITRLCRREYIASDIMAAAARAHIVLPEGDPSFLDYAVAEGKVLYFLEQVLPSAPDTIKLRYTNDQLQWMRQNVEAVWGWIIQNNLLFSTDMSQLRNLLDDAPKTNAFGDGSAPRTNSYLGWQIVRAYMRKSGASMQQLMEETDSQKILNQSGWRP